MKKLFLFCLMSCFLISNAKTLWDSYPVDFYTDMAHSRFFNVTFAQQDPDWLSAKALYDRSIHNEYSFSDKPRIPLIFHLIWLGSTVPESYQKLKSNLERLHPQCQVKLWTDKSIKSLNLINQAAYNAAQNYGEKSDILRCELLKTMGGVYLDGDFDVNKSMLDLFYAVDFFCSLLYDRTCTVNNGIIGSCPHHPIVQQMIAVIQTWAKNASPTSRIPGSPDYTPIQQRTGPYLFTRCFLDHKADLTHFNVALPVNYLQPLPYYDKHTNQKKLERYIKPHTMTIHRWAESWVTPNIQREIQINIAAQERRQSSEPQQQSLSKQITPHDRYMIDHVKKSILNANMGISKLTPSIIGLNGLSSAKVRHFLNNLCTLPYATYLEVGPYAGATLIAALYGNKLTHATAIENWSLWGDTTRQAFLANTTQLIPEYPFTLIEDDCFKNEVFNHITDPITIYFYDGQNDFESNKKALTHFHAEFAETFIAVIDDWNWEAVQEGTKSALEYLRYTILYEVILPAESNGDAKEWWNGLYVAVLKRAI